MAHDRFGFQVGFETEDAELASQAGLLESAEGRFRCIIQAVHEDASGHEVRRHVIRAREVGAKY